MDNIEEEIHPLIIYFVINGCVSLVSAFLGTWLWSWSGERQMARIRQQFFASIMKQDMTWFDTHEVGELNTRLAE